MDQSHPLEQFSTTKKGKTPHLDENYYGLKIPALRWAWIHDSLNENSTLMKVKKIKILEAVMEQQYCQTSPFIAKSKANGLTVHNGDLTPISPT